MALAFLAVVGGGDLMALAAVVAQPAARATTSSSSSSSSESAEPYFVRGRFAPAAARFRAGDWTGAADKFQEALAIPTGARPDADEPRARHLYGMALASSSRWREAADVFSAVWTKDALLADHLAYQSARCFLRAGDANAALTWSARVGEATVLAAESALISIDALTALQRHADLEAAAARFVATYPSSPRRHEAHFAQGTALAALGRTAEAARAFRQAWATAPSDTFATRAEDRLGALVNQGGEAASAARKSAREWLLRGTGLAERNRHDAAGVAFAGALAAPDLDPDTACRAHFGAGNALFKARQRQRAVTSFAAAEKACRIAKNDDFAARAMYQRGRSLVLTGDLAAAAQLFDQLETQHPAHRLADDARMREVEIAVDSGESTRGDHLLGTLAERYPKGDMADEAQWRLAFRAYRRGDHATARQILAAPSGARGTIEADLRGKAPEQASEDAPEDGRQDLTASSPTPVGGSDPAQVVASASETSGRATYFEARSWEGEGDVARAVAGYERTAREAPLSFYGLLAFNRLAEISPDRRALLLKSLRSVRGVGPRVSSAPGAVAAASSRDLGEARAVELARLGLATEAQRELARTLKRLGETAPDRAAGAAGVVARALDRGGFWNISHGLALGRLASEMQRHPPLEARPEGGAWELAYPRAFGDIVVSVSRRNDVPPALQWALMRQESGFDAHAESSANCLGLTMLKLATAAQGLGRPVTRDELFEPSINLAAGSKHLATLLRRYHGAVIPAVAAYNAGDTAVGRWLSERGDLPPDEFVETIPYEETRRYVKRVLAAYFAYAWLYDGTAFVPRVAVRTAVPGGQ